MPMWRFHVHAAVATAALAFGLAAAPCLAETVVVDNSDPGFSVISGTWSIGSLSGQYGTDYRYKTTRTSSPYNFVEWRPNLPSSGSYEVAVWYPPSSNRPNNARYTVYYDGGTQTVTVDQTLNASTWVSLGTFTFAAGTGGYVQLSDEARRNRTIVADAVRFYKPGPVDLTMAVEPAGSGTTSPAVGGPYTYTQNDVVSISATPADGYVFNHWTVSAGAEVADPTDPTTTVTMDQSKTVTAVFSVPVPQFRAFWADVFHYGLQNASQIDQMIGMAREGNYNAIVAEVLAHHDNPVGSHGAYWRSDIVARSSYVTSSFDPLAYMVQQAHANDLELHCWLVAFRVSTAWPPAGNTFLSSHPEYMMVPYASMGSGPATVGSDYVLDPGSPDAQEYLLSIVRELVTDYEIDGINWDYIRYTQTDAGYPADSNYANSGLKRFQRITGRTDVPPATGDTQWNDFRRRTIDELVRRVRAEIPTIPNPRQPLRYTADVVTWGDAPASFTSSSAYGLFSNWEYWLRMGWLDGGLPMCYDREYNSSQALYYRHWVDKCMIWRYDRHMYIGQAAYLNTMADSVTQMRYAYDAGANGTVNYSYWTTVDSDMNGTGENDFNWYPYVGANLFTAPAPVPSMPWRDPATAVEGTLYGRVLDGATMNPVDDATVQVGSLNTVQTDGNGYYVVTLIPATAAGTAYDVTVTKTGLSSAVLPGVTVLASTVVRQDIILSSLPVILQQPQSQGVCPGETATFALQASGSGVLSYRWSKDGADLSDGEDISGSTTATLYVLNAGQDDVGSYACLVTDSRGSTPSNTAALTLKSSPTITQDPQPQVVPAGGTAIFTVGAAGAGVLSYQWQKNGQDLTNNGHVSGVATETLTIQLVTRSDAAEYRCVVTADCGSVASNAATLSLPYKPGDFDGDGDVDQKDFAHVQVCLSGSTIPQDAPACLDTRFDGDTDVDSDDMAKFLGCFSGPNVESDPTCMN